MKFKVGDKVRAKVHGKNLVGVIKETNSGSRNNNNLVYFHDWHGGHDGNGCSLKEHQGDSFWYLKNEELELIERRENIMRKSDLENGAIVELRNGKKYILLFNCLFFDNQEDLFISLNHSGYLNFSNYNENLKNCYNKGFDIMKVCQNKYVGDNICSHILKQNENDWIWVREEETVMTISEIEEKLGISNLKIKKED